jgi:hypothetical protein
MNAETIIDQAGIYGTAFHYAMIFVFMGSAMMIFLYLWSKGRLDMDEDPKIQMMQEEEYE